MRPLFREGREIMTRKQKHLPSEEEQIEFVKNIVAAMEAKALAWACEMLMRPVRTHDDYTPGDSHFIWLRHLAQLSARYDQLEQLTTLIKIPEEAQELAMDGLQFRREKRAIRARAAAAAEPIRAAAWNSQGSLLLDYRSYTFLTEGIKRYEEVILRAKRMELGPQAIVKSSSKVLRLGSASDQSESQRAKVRHRCFLAGTCKAIGPVSRWSETFSICGYVSPGKRSLERWLKLKRDSIGDQEWVPDRYCKLLELAEFGRGLESLRKPH